MVVSSTVAQQQPFSKVKEAKTQINFLHPIYTACFLNNSLSNGENSAVPAHFMVHLEEFCLAKFYEGPLAICQVTSIFLN